jgi:hypothetical protein
MVLQGIIGNIYFAVTQCYFQPKDSLFPHLLYYEIKMQRLTSREEVKISFYSVFCYSFAL